MVWVTGPFAIAAAVLVIGGGLSLRDVRPARDALAGLGVPLPGLVARLAAPAELAVGALALLKGGRLPALAVAAAYGGFMLVLAGQLRQGPGSSCGCFGRLSTRPSRLHLTVDGVLALVALAAGISDAPGLRAAMGEAAGPLDAAALAGLVALAAGLTVTVLTVLPAAVDAARPTGAPVRTFEIGGRP